jgi:Leucine-rich repeat (LRR) protein
MAMLEVVLLLVMMSVVEGRGSCYEVTRYNLRNVICTDKQLTTVPPDLDPDVKVMYLDRNKLTQLTGDTFLPYVALQELYLENNDISSIAEDTFAPVTNLQVTLILTLTLT